MLVYFVYISTWKELADRYLLPIVPLLLLLAARLCVAFFRAAAGGARASLAPRRRGLLAARLVLPLTDSIAFNRSSHGPMSRMRAKTWVESNIPAGRVIASDTYGPPLVRGCDAPYYRAAGMRPGRVPAHAPQAAGARRAGRQHDLAGCASSGRAT